MASALSMRTMAPVRCSRPVARPSLRARARVVVKAAPQAVDQGELEAAIKEAEEVSAQSKTARQQADELSRQSNQAWEKVEALKAQSRDPNVAGSDPLEQFCEGDPSADECRVYED